MAGWKKIWENEMTDKSLTNKELEEKFSLDYVNAIKTLGLDRDNWEKLKKQFPNLKIEKTIENFAPEFDVPEEVNYDSDCDGYDTCWINKWHFTKNGLLIFEQYSSCSNKQYGNYYPNAPNTLAHVLIVFKKQS